MFWFWGTWKQIDSIFDSLTSLQWLLVWMAIWLISTAVLEFWERLRSALLSVTTVDGPVLTSRYARVVYATAMGVFCFLVAILLNQPAPTIVYKGF
jgi:alginate O-acetyltransferase complex protein AlgI